jgi:glycosyltransferase involved in cell wall biosynthesis
MSAAVQEFVRSVRSIPAGAARRIVVATPRAPKSSFMADLYREILDPETPWLAVPPTELADVSAAAAGMGAEMLVHVHWTSWALGRLDRAPAEAALQRALGILESVRKHRMVWTVHNTLPHDCRHEDLEVTLRRHLADQADLIHIMNPMTREIVAPWYELPDDKVVQADHPWPRVVGIGRDEACRMLGLNPRYRWIGFLGQIRPYKRVDILLDTMDRLSPDHRCIIAGATDGSDEMRSVVARAQRHPRTVVLSGHQPDAVFHAVAEAVGVVVLPYIDILNSGVHPLAAAVGCPVVMLGSESTPAAGGGAGGDPDERGPAATLVERVLTAQSSPRMVRSSPSLGSLRARWWA